MAIALLSTQTWSELSPALCIKMRVICRETIQQNSLQDNVIRRMLITISNTMVCNLQTSMTCSLKWCNEWITTSTYVQGHKWLPKTKSVQFFTLILWYFMFWIKKKYFLRKMDQFWTNLNICLGVFLAKSLQKTCFYVHKKLQRNPSVGSCLKFFIFRPYGFDYLGFLTNARRGAMRSKTQWVI